MSKKFTIRRLGCLEAMTPEGNLEIQGPNGLSFLPLFEGPLGKM